MSKINSPKGLRVPYALAVHDLEEERNVLRVLREHRTNIGVEVSEFEKNVTKYFGKNYGIMVNSGSSANLIALELLNLPRGSEVITPMLTFSTTVSPILKLGLVPVFADVISGEYTIDVEQIEKLINKKTKALMIPLLFGNVPNLRVISKIAKKYKLFLIDDSCDTLGATFEGRPTGSYTDITTTSFFGSHIITAGGNGGMVFVNDEKLRDRAKVLRGWGRSSSLFSESEDINLRFKYKIGDIPYDAKFVFEEIGYNFLPNEMGAAFGNAQLNKLSKFKKTREKNFKILSKYFSKYSKYFQAPVQNDNVKTQWLAYPLTIKPNSPFTRLEITTFLENNNIQTRPIFTGNIRRQPAFKNAGKAPLKDYPISDYIMINSFVIGSHHGIENKHLKKLMNTFDLFLKKFN